MPLLLLLLLLLLAPAVPLKAPVGTAAPSLPRQFSADVAVTSHLTEPQQAYPPSVRLLRVRYDWERRLARAEVLQGRDQGKVFVRRYDAVRWLEELEYWSSTALTCGLMWRAAARVRGQARQVPAVRARVPGRGHARA